MSLKTKEHFMQRIWKIQRKCDFFIVKITFWSCAFTKSFFEIWETKMTNPVKYLSHWRFQAHKLIRELRVPYLEHLAFVSLFVYLDQQVYSCFTATVTWNWHDRDSLLQISVWKWATLIDSNSCFPFQIFSWVKKSQGLDTRGELRHLKQTNKQQA